MAKLNKAVVRTLGVSLVALAGITGVYQYNFSKFEKGNKIAVVVAKKTINPSQTITDKDLAIEYREENTLSDGVITNKDDLIGNVVSEPIYAKETILKSRVISEEEYKKMNYRQVSIKGTEDADTFQGYSIKPYDKVDLLYFDEKGNYEGSVFLEDQIIYDIKSSNGVSYQDQDGSFTPAYALIWVPQDIAEEIAQRQEVGGYFKLQLHRDKQEVQ